jgi:hypothetical protein
MNVEQRSMLRKIGDCVPLGRVHRIIIFEVVNICKTRPLDTNTGA